jgi:hypothetical protein
MEMNTTEKVAAVVFYAHACTCVGHFTFGCQESPLM